MTDEQKVVRIRTLYDEIIAILETDRQGFRDERARHASIAITDAETAQMRAVRALTFTREDSTNGTN